MIETILGAILTLITWLVPSLILIGAVTITHLSLRDSGEN